jgi:hypothetical protein
MQRSDRFASRANLINDRARKRVGKEVAQTAADDRVIVDQHDAQRR